MEAKQIYMALTQPNHGWRHHPAVKMWRGHEAALASYGTAICAEWRKRGYQDTLLPWFEERTLPNATLPPWLGNSAFHASHRSNLLRKDAVWYGRFEWNEPNDLPYVWPVRKGEP